MFSLATFQPAFCSWDVILSSFQKNLNLICVSAAVGEIAHQFQLLGIFLVVNLCTF